MSNDLAVQPAIVIFDKGRAEACGVAPVGVADPTFFAPITKVQREAGGVRAMVTNDAGQMVAPDGAVGGVPVVAEVNELTGVIDLSVVGAGGLARSVVAGMDCPFSITSGASGAGYTFVNQWQARGPFDAVQLVYKNFSGAPITITAAGVAAVGWDFADGVGVPKSIASGSLTIPAATGSGNNVIPGVAAYPVQGIQSINDRYLLQTRSYIAASGSFTAVGDGHLAAFQAATGRKFAAARHSGDIVSTWSEKVTGRGTSDKWMMPTGVRFFGGAQRRFSVAVIGDSRARGVGSSANMSNSFHLAARTLQSQGLCLDVDLWAFAGQNHASSMAIAEVVLGMDPLPNAMALHFWSPNDSAASTDLMNQYFAETLEVIQLCIRKRVVPIVFTSAPGNWMDATTRDRLLALNAKVRALTQLVIVDEFAAVAPDGLVIAPEFAADTNHFTDAGYAAIEPLTRAAVVKAYNQSIF